MKLLDTRVLFYKHLALEALERLATRKFPANFLESCGLCMNLDGTMRAIFDERPDSDREPEYSWYYSEHVANHVLKELTPAWQDYTGNYVFPVPSPYAELAPEQAYHEATLDKWTGPYGELRMELVRFLRDTLFEELYNAN